MMLKTSVAVPPDDAGALAEAVSALLEDEPRREALGVAARQLVIETTSWSAYCPPTGDDLRLGSWRRQAGRCVRYVPRSPWFRAALVLPSLAAVIVLLWWRGPDWNLVARAFDIVDWAWIVFAIGLNLASVLVRSLAWRLTIHQALDPPHPRFDQVFSAFSIGLLQTRCCRAGSGTARVAVLRRHLPHGPGTTGTLVGTVFAHRLFDLFPAVLLVLYVLSTAKIPHGLTSLIIVLVAGGMLFTVAVVSAKRGRRRPSLDGARPLRRLLVMARQGLAVLRSPLPAAGAIVLQTAGWVSSSSPSTWRCAPSASTPRFRRRGSCCC